MPGLSLTPRQRLQPAGKWGAFGRAFHSPGELASHSITENSSSHEVKEFFLRDASPTAPDLAEMAISRSAPCPEQ